MFRKRLAIGGMAVLICVLSAVPASAETVSFQPHGRAAVLLDASSGQILYQQNAQDKNFPASTTKLLTAIVAVEHGKLDQKVQVSARAVDQAPDSSSCYLEKGEEQTLDNLLRGLLLVSGNDCAVAIGEGVAGGNLDQFVTWMNQKAKDLGAVNTHFANPSGLHDPNHYTTALDLALIARAAFANPTLKAISGSKGFDWPGKSQINGTYYNHNQMLFSYAGTYAGKTGYTEEANHTLVNAAERNGIQLIGVVMGEPSNDVQYSDMTDMLDMGFANFERKAAVTAGSAINDVAVTGGVGKTVTAVATQDFLVAAPKGQAPTVTVTPKLNASVTAPVQAGEALGVLEIRDGNTLLGTVPAVAKDGIAAKPKTGARILAATLSALKWLAAILVGLFLFRTVVKLVRRGLRRSRRRSTGYKGLGNRKRGGVIGLYRTRD